MNAPAPPRSSSPLAAGRTWVAAFAVLTLLLLAAGWWYYRSEARSIRAHRHEELAAIGELKAGQIQLWRRERMNDATRMAGGPLVRKAVTEFLREPGGPLRADLRERLRIERTAGGYADALIFAPDGKLLLAANDAPEPLAPATRQLLAAALASQEAVLSDFFRHADDVVHIEAAAVVRDAAGRPLAVAVLRSDAAAYLYPMIQSWPTPSRSGETFIVQREGDSIVFLNEARHRAGTALTLRQPLTRKEIPAVQAVLGRQGIFEGVDYRGAKVLADLRPIAGTPWFMVAKVDAGEIFAEARTRAGWIALVVGSLILVVAAATAAINRQQGVAEIQRLNAYNRSLIEASPDPLVTISAEGKITDVNEASVQATGVPREQLIGTDFSTYFTTPEQARAGYRQAFSEGFVRDYPLAIRHTSGRVTEVLYNATVYKDAQGKVLGVFAAARDITQRKQAELQREQYFKLFTTSNDLMCIADPNGAFQKTNPAFTRTLGYSEAELVSRPFVEFIHPEDKQPTLDEMARQQRLGYSLNFENRYRCKDGSYRWLSWRANYIPEEGLTYATARDVTELKRAEAALRQAGTYNRSLIEASLDPLVTISPEGKITDVNEASVLVTGVRRETLIGTDFSDYFTEPDKARAGYRQVFSEGFVRDYPLAIRHTSGRVTEVLYNASVYKDAQGQVLGVFAAARDITEHKRAEAALRQSREDLNRAQAVAQTGSWRMDVRRNELVWSDENYRIFGVPQGTPLTYESFLSRVHPEDREYVDQQWKAALEGKPYDIKHRLQMESGQVKWVRERAELEHDETGALRGGIGTTQDVTELHRAEEAIRQLNADLERRVRERTGELTAANQELESFSYAVSHDLRAPLRAMCGFSQALVEDFGATLQGEARVYLEQIIRASRHMSELVDGLLTLSRCTRGELRRDPVDLSALCERIRGELTRAEPERQVEWQIQPGLVARGDPRMIEVAMNNLLGNAWKYTGRQPAPVIRVYAEPGDGRQCFCVADNGAGFDMKHTEQLFKPFQRLHRQEEFPGTGIGLATVRRILHRHGGTIQATAAVGQGATFKFSLPELDTLNPSSL